MSSTETYAERVHNLVRACLYKTPPESTESALRVEGVVMRLGFNPLAVDQHRTKIEALIEEVVPDAGYDGASFLSLCMARDGVQWGEHRDVDALVCLALAVGRAVVPFPREVWRFMPGGVPYIIFLRQGLGASNPPDTRAVPT